MVGDHSMSDHLLVQCVRDWGPLWAYSCFSFESANNHLKKLFHGSKDMSKQVIKVMGNSVIIIKTMISLFKMP